MHRLILVGALALGGCATAGGVQGVKDQIKLVQEYTKLACAFVPAAATISSIASASAGQSVEAIGNSICNAVTSIPLSQGGARSAYVGKVRVKGQFTDGRKV